MLPDSLLETVYNYLYTRQSDTHKTAADFYIRSLPGLSGSSQLKLYSGHLPAYDDSESSAADPHLFFLLAKAKHIPDIPKLVIWFNGGPGCSSMDGAFMEIGPLRVVSDGDGLLAEADYAWNEYADILFIDQPAGTGYSYINTGESVAELSPAANQVVTFLQNFFEIFPELRENDVYLAGESYAGQYIPYIATAMLKSAVLDAPLKGILMGNAWIDPTKQYPAYLDFAYMHGLVEKDSDAAERAEEINDKCNQALNGTDAGKILVQTCEALVDAVLPPRETIDDVDYCVSGYNIKLKTPCFEEYPKAVVRVRPYLSAPAVKQALHAVAKTGPWQQCNNTVANHMWSPLSRPSIELLPALLDQINVLLYAGDLDMMCNWLGIRKSIDAMTWQGQTGLINATEMEWSVNGSHIGSWQTARNLSWVRFAGASHMVPIDEPLASLDMLQRFIGIDTLGLSAAGRTAQIPSRLGQEQESVIGGTTVEGDTLVLDSPAEVLDPEVQEEIQEMLEVAENKSREEFYGPRRTMVLSLILVAVITCTAYLIHWLSKRHRRAREKRRQRKQSARRSMVKAVFQGKGKEREDDVELQALITERS